MMLNKHEIRRKRLKTIGGILSVVLFIEAGLLAVALIMRGGWPLFPEDLMPIVITSGALMVIAHLSVKETTAAINELNREKEALEEVRDHIERC